MMTVPDLGIRSRKTSPFRTMADAPKAGMFDWLPSPLTCIAVLGYFILNLALNYYNAFILGNGGGTGRGLHLPIPVR